jgi:hypothetical protein
MSDEYHAGSYGQWRESADQMPDESPAGSSTYNPPGSWAGWRDYRQDTTRRSDPEPSPPESPRSSASSDLEPPPPNNIGRARRRSGVYLKWSPRKLEFFKKWSAAEWEPWLQSMPDEGPHGFSDKCTKLQWLGWYLACRAHYRMLHSSSKPDQVNPDPVMDELIESWELGLTLSSETKKRRMR